MTPGRALKKHEAVADQVADLADQGFTRNEIARRLGCARDTVTRAARHAGVTFDAPPAEAIRGRRRQAVHDRAELAELAAEIADKAGRQLLDVLDGDDPTRTRALATAFGVSVDKVAALARVYTPEDEQDGIDHARSVMGRFVAAVEAQVSARDVEDATTDPARTDRATNQGEPQ